ncbi:pilus assembly protein [Herbaspirillum sp. WKF16]|uniref:pilus assembly protein n=1 Tax=Herbaspirillum sp. WKF16 TaxID=3028312 RepID=UPI0023AA01FD|nr:pilus assembly protein [Herbaspirillum sp. WKF16]WDZ95556.1 pilus assembly protein [Herbaspirillum sp. WKF16]
MTGVPRFDRFDFSASPEQRRRRREQRFYRQLACAAVLGALPVLALSWRIDARTAALAAANRVLDAELHILRPQLAQALAARQAIATMQARLDGLDRQAARRAQAARLLRRASLAMPLQGRLERIALRAGDAELRGYASATSDVQAYAEALARAGLDGIAIRDLKKDGDAAQRRYAFTLSVRLPAMRSS